MKVLYITVPSFFDLEISLIRELSHFCDIKVVMIVSPESIHSSAFNIKNVQNECKLYKSSEYEGFQQYSKLVDTDRWMIANNPDNSFKSCLNLSRQIKRYIKAEHVDIVHSTTDCKTSLFLLPFLRTRKHKLYTTHDPIPHKEYNGISVIRKWISYDLMFMTFGNLLLLSNSLEIEFKRLYSGKFKRLFYSKLGVYDFLCSFNENRVIEEQYILFFGRIDYYKGVDILIRAYQKSSLPKHNIKLIIAGKGTIGVEKELINENVVVLNRYIENSELASLIKNSTFIVLPYRTVTQSGVLKSAYAFDKPVLATRTGSFISEIKEGEEGILVNPSDEKDLLRGLEQMVNSDLDNFSKRIHSRYSISGEEGWRSIAHDLVINVYSRVLSE